jgi:MYXO-CTERM domain-containing protein
VSADGRKLILIVVDGRTTVSVGMRCTELADLMVELGAADAVNLDGGGSSTMWVAGDGVVNDPSDGAQRTVGNHLGVVASGAGEPGSCDRSWEESTLHGELADASTTTDIDGDGDADLCARAGAGVRCWRADEGAFVEEIVGPAWSDETGWDAVNRFSTLRMGDIDGDGDADLCGRDATGVQCFASDGLGFPIAIVGPALSDEAGWTDPAYHGSLRMADVDGDGKDDLCARASNGLHCWRSTGAAFAEPFVLADLSDAAGFAAMANGGTIRMADIDADARIDVCARTVDGMRCWISTGAGFGPGIVGPEWSDAAGWQRVEYWSTIRLVDIDGDRRADLCGRSATGMVCHLSTGTGFGEAILGPGWADESGWGDYANYSTIRFGDLEGDGDLDACARANAGIRCHPWQDGAFATEAIVGPALADDAGWGSIRFFSTIRMLDVDADGADEICARNSEGVQCWSSADAFLTPIAGPPLADANGWDAPPYYETIRGVTPRMHCVVEERSCDGVDEDCDGEIDEGCDENTTGGSGDGVEDDGSDGDGTAADDGGSDGGNSLPVTFGESEDAGGCACRTTPRDPTRAGWLVLLLGAALARVRVASRRRRG